MPKHSLFSNKKASQSTFSTTDLGNLFKSSKMAKYKHVSFSNPSSKIGFYNIAGDQKIFQISSTTFLLDTWKILTPTLFMKWHNLQNICNSSKHCFKIYNIIVIAFEWRMICDYAQLNVQRAFQNWRSLSMKEKRSAEIIWEILLTPKGWHTTNMWPGVKPHQRLKRRSELLLAIG